MLIINTCRRHNPPRLPARYDPDTPYRSARSCPRTAQGPHSGIPPKVPDKLQEIRCAPSVTFFKIDIDAVGSCRLHVGNNGSIILHAPVEESAAARSCGIDLSVKVINNRPYLVSFIMRLLDVGTAEEVGLPSSRIQENQVGASVLMPVTFASC